jgi:hypothetical protein
VSKPIERVRPAACDLISSVENGLTIAWFSTSGSSSGSLLTLSDASPTNRRVEAVLSYIVLPLNDC